jgi:hypothetical protein
MSSQSLGTYSAQPSDVRRTMERSKNASRAPAPPMPPQPSRIPIWAGRPFPVRTRCYCLYSHPCRWSLPMRDIPRLSWQPTGLRLRQTTTRNAPGGLRFPSSSFNDNGAEPLGRAGVTAQPPAAKQDRETRSNNRDNGKLTPPAPPSPTLEHGWRYARGAGRQLPPDHAAGTTPFDFRRIPAKTVDVVALDCCVGRRPA